MQRQRAVILFTGVPGVGKTTVARLLADRVSGVHVDLSGIAEIEGITTGVDRRRRTSLVDLEGMRARLVQIMEVGREILIFDGHFAADVVPPETVLYAFVLRRAPWKLRVELSDRGFPMEKVMENVEAELLDVCLVETVKTLGPERVCEIDTTDSTPEEVVEEVMSVIQASKPCLHGHVDWLGHIESKKLLEEIGRCT